MRSLTNVTRSRLPAGCQARRLRPGVARGAAKGEAAAALVASLEELVAMKQAGKEDAALEKQIEVVKQRSQEAGANRIVPALNDGTFKGIPLTGPTQQATSKPLPLGALTFGVMAPKDLMVTMTDDVSVSNVFKGEGFGRTSCYTLSSGIKLGEAGVCGVSHAIGVYKQSADHPARLDITFQAVRLEPVLEQEGDLQAWLEALQADNPSMDAGTGVCEVTLPTGIPPGWQDYHVMIPGWQLVMGNRGSYTLLRNC